MANPKGNPQNFRPFSPDEARKNGSKGGTSKGKKDKVRVTIRDAMIEVLSEDDWKKLKAMVHTAVDEAIKGNAKFWELVRDTIGEKPVDKVQMKTDVNIADSAERLSNIFEQIKDDK